MRRAVTTLAMAMTAMATVLSSVAVGQARFDPLPAGWDQGIKFFAPEGAPVGGRAIFVVKIGGYDRIIAADLEMKVLTPIVDGPGNNFSPALSPDGLRVAFTSDRDGNREIYVADFDGQNVRRITANRGVDDYPGWSPDSRKLIFSSSVGGKPGSNLYAVVALGSTISKAVQITTQKGRNSMPAWSPDGRYVAYTTDRFWPGFDVCVTDLKTQNEVCPLQGKRSFFRPSWSQTSKSIHYLSGELGSTELGIFNLEKKTYNTLLQSVVRPDSVVFLKDDKYFLFTSTLEADKGGIIYIKDIRSDKFGAMLKSPYPLTGLTWADGSSEELSAKRRGLPSAEAGKP